MSYRYSKPNLGDEALDAAVLALVDQAGVQHDRDLVIQMLASVLRMSTAGNARGDMKMVERILSDVGRSHAKFLPYREFRKCSVFGSARTQPGTPNYKAAEELGAALAEAQWMVITGGGPGIMTAAVHGAGVENSFGVTIALPFEPDDAGGLLPEDRLIRFRHFFTRKVTFMRESSAFVSFPGGFGTLDETFELLTLLQTGKETPCPVVLCEVEGGSYWTHWMNVVRDQLVTAGLVSPEDLDLVHISHDTTDALEYITGFFRVYHSTRWVGKRLIVRCQKAIADAALDDLNERFSEIVLTGSIERTETSPQELDDHDEVDLPRLAFHFDNRHFSRLHQLAQALNVAEIM